ncbi:MAG: hypothetical protein ABWX76_08050 [Leifsonia flava]
MPPPPVPPATPVRLYIAPVNYAGQAWQWARAAERNIPGVGAVSMSYRVGTEFGHPVDISVPALGYVMSKSWQRAQRQAVHEGFTHVIVEAGRHIFGRVFDQTVEHQVRELQADGIRVAMLAHGSDVRLPSRHAVANPHSPYLDESWPDVPGLQKEAERNRALFDRLGLPVFVSTPDLLLDVPYGQWLPVVVDRTAWTSTSDVLARPRPIVAHAPSKSVVKGSALIDPILRKLHDAGTIEYLRISGVPADEMPAVYGSADIVLDQFRLGDYGVAACEALAAGRLVLGHVSVHSRGHVAAVTGRELPIVEATVDTLEDVLTGVLADRDHYRAIAADGPQFVAAVHDGRRSADVLRPFLTNSPGATT